MRGMLVICDTHNLYARRISDYIRGRKKDEYDLRIYSSASLMASALSDCKISIMLISEECFKELSEGSPELLERIDNLWVLYSEMPPDAPDNTGAGFVYRYQSAGEIYRLICESESYQGESKRPSDKEESPIKLLKLSVKKEVQDKLLLLGALTDDETLKVIDECLQRALKDYKGAIDFDEKARLRNLIFYSIRGLDILEELIADESITEIMVNGENNIFYEREGRLVNSGKSFDSREMLLDIIRKIVAAANRTVNMSSPIVDARLSDGSRINAVLEPVSLDGPILTIRRFPKEPFSADRLILLGAVSEEIMEFLRKLVYSGYNILVSGSTGSGKTTFLNILSGFIPKDERIITIEDSAELKIMGIKNLVRLESRNAGTEGCAEITIRDLIKSALRMRPDRVIVGECRGAEATDMLQSFLVGQDGSMSTIHANSAEDALYRLEMLIMLGNEQIPLPAIRRQIASGVDIIIQLGRLKDKSRKLLEIIEVTGYEDGMIKTGLLYKYEDGKFVKHENIRNTYKLEKAGCL